MESLLVIGLFVRGIIGVGAWIIMEMENCDKSEIVFTSALPVFASAISLIVSSIGIFPLPVMFTAFIAGELLFSFGTSKGKINVGSAFLLTLLLFVYLGNI